MTKKIGFLGGCATPYCDGIDGFFCVRCRTYVATCRCTPGACRCGTDRYWAGAHERPAVRELLRRDVARGAA